MITLSMNKNVQIHCLLMKKLVKSQKIPFFHKSGELKGLPTKMHTILIMWAYSPYIDKIKEIKSKNLLKNLTKK